MVPLKILVGIFALIGAWFFLQLSIGFLFSNSSEVVCYVSVSETFGSPTNENALVYEIKTCGNRAPTSSLSINDPSDSRSSVTFLEVPSTFTNSSGVVNFPVSFGVKWNGEYSVTIYYPKGLDLGPWFSSTNLRGLDNIRFEHYGVSIELRQYET